jgi:predicted RNA-binding Zn-ribbon protein involved in translation (DUF1610 family)
LKVASGTLMKTPKLPAKCPMCGDPSSYEVAYCHRCQYRLPWADVVEGIEDHETESLLDETPALDRFLKKEGLLPERTLACRFCNERIQVDDRQCPHCGEWLIASNNFYSKLDAWAGGHRLKDTVKVNMQSLKAGCFTVVPFVMLLVYGCFRL